jgi:hypothetical protein
MCRTQDLLYRKLLRGKETQLDAYATNNMIGFLVYDTRFIYVCI